MTGRQRVHTLLVAGLLSWMAAQSQAQQYSMKALGVGPPAQVYYNFTTPKINNSGQVVGNRQSSGYVYSYGALTSLANRVFALDISNNGMIATFNQSLGDSFLSGPPYSSLRQLTSED